MNNQFIVLKPYQYVIECTCPNPEHKLIINFNKGDNFKITEDKRYVDGMGWFVVVVINNEQKIYMNVLDLEEVYKKGDICTFMDLELKINYLEFKINDALDKFDQSSFHLFVAKLSVWNDLKKHIVNSINI